MIQCNFDLDGVLANFIKGALEWHKKEGPVEEWDFFAKWGVSEKEFWEDKGFDFWRLLEPYADGMSLLKEVEEACGEDSPIAMQIGLMSSPCETAGCCDAKREWVREYLPQYYKRLTLVNEKEQHAGPTKILIDDSDSNCKKWRNAGGRAILVPRTWNVYKCDTFQPELLAQEVRRIAEAIDLGD